MSGKSIFYASLLTATFSVSCVISRADEMKTPQNPAKQIPGAERRAVGPCASDVKRLCPGIQTGGGRVDECLKAHEAELSTACKERISKIKKNLGDLHQACEEDIHNLCAEVQPGQGRIIQCLHQHKDQLSDQCKAAIAIVGSQRQGRQNSGQRPADQNASQGAPLGK